VAPEHRANAAGTALDRRHTAGAEEHPGLADGAPGSEHGSNLRRLALDNTGQSHQIGGMSVSPILGPMGPLVTDHRLTTLLGDWSADGHGTLARRLAQGLRKAIVGGLLPDGARLPAERHLAELLSVSRSTVTTALDELRSEGLLRSQQGRGTEVVGPGEVMTGHRVGAHFVSRGVGIDLAAVVPTDGSHLPPLSLTTADLVAGRGLLEPHGLPALREALARVQTAHSRPTEASQIHVTHGAHHAIGLAIAAIVPAGAAIALEVPSYPGILDLIDHHRARAVGIPDGPGGPDPEGLARVLATERPAAVYLQTGVHNPTGHVLSAARRRAIADVLDAHGDAVVIEDNTLADLVYTGRPRPSMAEACRIAPVVTVESLSKTAWAALRIGWLRATGVVSERIGGVRLATDLGPSVPSQLLALQLLPHLPQMAEDRRRELEAATVHAAARIREELPAWSLEPPAGSSALWPRLPVPDATPFVALARRHGVHVTPGSVHVLSDAPDPHLRFCVDRPRGHVDEGLDRLVAAWHDASSRSSRALA